VLADAAPLAAKMASKLMISRFIAV
jgi:hypothetical protein